MGQGAALGKEAVLAGSGRAGEESGPFEHPARCTPVILDAQASEILSCPQSFSAAC